MTKVEKESWGRESRKIARGKKLPEIKPGGFKYPGNTWGDFALELSYTILSSLE
jgi:hypothetical protein